MPIYEYECKECGQRFEKMQPVTAEPLTECINCGKGPVRRVFHPVGVIFKGSGWYINDSRKNTSTGGGESKSDSSSASDGSTASTTKPEKSVNAD
jgi:putative FmdB family regulatory protein